jgi:spore coat polysaccharide biosynthesis protein SpsF (cytidylyltransferase family)
LARLGIVQVGQRRRPTILLGEMRTWAVVTGRMGSERLPGKTVAEIAGRPSLGWICLRAEAATSIDGVVVATSDEPGDSVIRDWCVGNGLPCHSGSLDNVLDRTLGAARSVSADRLVFINGDSPLTDPAVIDAAVARHDRGDADYVSSVHGGGGYPDGYSVEVFLASSLELVARSHGADVMVREHTTIPFYAPGGPFRAAPLTPARSPHAGLHLSLDTESDLGLIRDIYRALIPSSRTFGYDEVMRLLEDDPGLLARAATV